MPDCSVNKADEQKSCKVWFETLLKIQSLKSDWIQQKETNLGSCYENTVREVK